MAYIFVAGMASLEEIADLVGGGSPEIIANQMLRNLRGKGLVRECMEQDYELLWEAGDERLPHILPWRQYEQVAAQMQYFKTMGISNFAKEVRYRRMKEQLKKQTSTKTKE